MKFRLLLAGLFIAASASSAMAAGPYLGASGGIAIIHDSDVDVTGFGSGTIGYEVGGGFNVNAGYNFGNVRLEGEFGYKTAAVEHAPGADVTIWSYLVNGFYDFKTGSPLTPFLGAGLGVVNGELKVQGDKVEDTELGYQVMVGAGYQVNPHLTLDLSYRYQGAASDFADRGVGISYGSSNLLAGLRYNF